MSQASLEDIHLKADDLRISFGGVQALAGVGLDVRRGEIFSLIRSAGISLWFAGRASRMT